MKRISAWTGGVAVVVCVGAGRIGVGGGLGSTGVKTVILGWMGGGVGVRY